MNRKFLIMVATICGLVMVISLLLLPMVTMGEGEHSRSMRAISPEFGVGHFLLLFSWFAAGFSALVFFKKTDLLGMSEQSHLAVSFLAFKLTMLFVIALLIEGTGEHASWGVAFWFTFLAGIVGTLAVYLTFNPALAKKLADAAAKATEDDEKKDDAKAE